MSIWIRCGGDSACWARKWSLPSSLISRCSSTTTAVGGPVPQVVINNVASPTGDGKKAAGLYEKLGEFFKAAQAEQRELRCRRERRAG